MTYTIIDIIDKLIQVEQKAAELYRNMCENCEKTNPIKILSEAFAKEEVRHVQFYYNLKKELEDKVDKEIDFRIYDKISSLIIEFSSRLNRPEVQKTTDIVKFAIKVEEENLALLLDIQGRFVSQNSDVDTVTYKALDSIIKEEGYHIKRLKPYVVK